MRGKPAIVACVGLGLLATACNPVAERRYIDEGAGVNLYTADSVAQAQLLEAYTEYLCQQIGAGCNPASMTFVVAGMNDIDQRCDGYLTWLDGRRRDRAPVLAQLAATGAAIHTIMTVTGSSPASLDILSAAFGLASATYSNWNSRMLIAVEQSTVQAVVYKSQGDYRKEIKDWLVSDRPTAIYLLRNYLRTCMPMNIEASINLTTSLVQRGAAEQAKRGLVVANVTSPRPAIIRDINVPLRRFEAGTVIPVGSVRLGEYEPTMSSKDMKFVLTKLCRPTTEADLGPEGSSARTTLASFLASLNSAPVQILDRNAFISLQETKKRACSS